MGWGADSRTRSGGVCLCTHWPHTRRRRHRVERKAFVKPVGDGWESGWGPGDGGYKTVAAAVELGRMRLERNFQLLMPPSQAVTQEKNRRRPQPSFFSRSLKGAFGLDVATDVVALPTGNTEQRSAQQHSTVRLGPCFPVFVAEWSRFMATDGMRMSIEDRMQAVLNLQKNESMISTMISLEPDFREFVDKEKFYLTPTSLKRGILQVWPPI